MLLRLRGVLWRTRQRSRSIASNQRSISNDVRAQNQPLAATLIEAAQTRLTSERAKSVCDSVLQAPVLQQERQVTLQGEALAQKGVHAHMIECILRMNTGRVHRDVLLSELLKKIWEHDLKLPDSLFEQVCVSCGVMGLQRTRALVHRHILSSHFAYSETIWRAMLDAHAKRNDWARVEQGLAECAVRQIPTYLDRYRYALLRLQDQFSDQSPDALIAVLDEMRRVDQRLDDRLLAALINTLGMRNLHGRRSHIPYFDKYGYKNSTYTLLDDLYERLENKPDSFQQSLSSLLLVQFNILETTWYAIPQHSTTSHVFVKQVLKFQQRIPRCESLLNDYEGVLQSIHIRLLGMHGEFNEAAKHLTAFLTASSYSGMRAKHQRNTLLALVRSAARLPSAERLVSIKHLLQIASNQGIHAHLWRGIAGKHFPRLWQRALLVLAKDTKDTHAPSPCDWNSWKYILHLLQISIKSTPHVPQCSWAAVLNHPRVCQMLVRAAQNADDASESETHFKELSLYFQRFHVPDRALQRAHTFNTNRSSSRLTP
ncbi:hypothetical protein MYAM1_002117 [Malassezia yamatoensis]|uniref:Uncharacterized protein n=1 Tax=Malassezia yamatoensis TaxID=253288 RepID=A0AAJ6CI11_9BASI|nr:hypothetical protein MYAM1_002117 [Malassezia yamatoensis]